MRAFLAIELPDALRAETAALQTTLRAAGADVKWVEPANLHLTVKFLGEIDEGCVAGLEDALRSTTLHHSPFTLMLEGVGGFPSTGSPRVLWVGVVEGKEAREGGEGLVALVEVVEQACEKLGFPKEERPWTPHLTIGRVRSPHASFREAKRGGLAKLTASLQAVEFRGATPAPVDHLTLFQSTLSPTGPTHTPLATFPLQPP